MNCEIVTCPNGVCYSCPPTKVVVTNIDATFDELEANVYQSLSIDRLQTQLKMSFRYPIFGTNGISNYIQVPIKNDNNVRGMFIFVAQVSNIVQCQLVVIKENK